MQKQLLSKLGPYLAHKASQRSLYTSFYVVMHTLKGWHLKANVCQLQCDQIWYIFYQIQLNELGHSPCFEDLQYLEHEGVVPPNLSSFGKKIAHMVTLTY